MAATSSNGSYVNLSAAHSDVSTREIVCSFLREMDTANACIRELHAALARHDRDQIVMIGFGLHAAWWRARLLLAGLELVSHQVESFARDALRHSRELARDPWARAWSLLHSGTAASREGGWP